MIKLYFAHNFNKRKEYRKLELQLEKELGIELLNPFYDDISRTTEMRKLDSGEVKKWHIVDEKELVARDLKNLASCDGLFTIIEKPSIGTTLEIANATLMKKEIFIVSKDYIDHPWIKIYANHRFQNVEQFKALIKFIQKHEKKEKAKKYNNTGKNT